MAWISCGKDCISWDDFKTAIEYANRLGMPTMLDTRNLFRPFHQIKGARHTVAPRKSLLELLLLYREFDAIPLPGGIEKWASSKPI